MESEIRQKRLQCLYYGLLLSFLLLTNRWLPWQESIEYSQANDVLLYEKIAGAAPHFLVEPITHHHAQRFLSHYLVGCISAFTHFSLDQCYRFVSILLLFACCFCAQKILTKFRLSASGQFTLLALFMLNPYAMRYYLLAFGMIQDITFLLASLLLVWALVDANILLLLFACGIATVCRQTALMFIPGILLWTSAAPSWKEFAWSKRILSSTFAISTILLCYLLTDRFSRSFSLPSRNLDHVLGLFLELRDSTTSLKAKLEDLMELFLRVLIPFFLPISLFFLMATKRVFHRVELWASLLIICAIASQPVLAGIILTGKNGSRLSALGLAFILVPLALAFQDSLRFQSQKFFYLLLGFIAIASFHHMYSVLGPGSAVQFLLWQLSLAILVFFIGRRVS